MAEKKAEVVANPLAPEIYADRTGSVAVRGNVARITLVSERAADDARDASQVVSGHVAMSVRGFLHLFAQMQSVVRQMEASGLVKAPESEGNAAAKKPAPAKKKAPSRSRASAGSRNTKSKKT